MMYIKDSHPIRRTVLISVVIVLIILSTIACYLSYNQAYDLGYYKGKLEGIERADVMIKDIRARYNKSIDRYDSIDIIQYRQLEEVLKAITK